MVWWMQLLSQAFVLGLLTVVVGNEGHVSDQDVCNEDNACPEVHPRGTALLQHRRSDRLLNRVEVSEDLDKAKEETHAQESEGSTVEVYNGAQLIIHASSEVATTGKGRWIFTVEGNFTTADVHSMGEHMPQGSQGDFEGDPDHGGLSVFMMEGTKKQVQEELDTHAWLGTPTVETDRTWGVVPEVEPEDSDGGAALLESSGNSTWVDSWGLDRIDSREGRDNRYTPPDGVSGAGVHVFIFDTGIRTTHWDFKGRAIPTLEVLSPRRRVCSAGDTECAIDRAGHGTHCAGTIGGFYHGVAKGATLHAVKIIGDGGVGSMSWFLEALDWVMTSRLRPAVVSASLAAEGHLPSVSMAIDRATGAGVTVVVAAGNDGDTSKPSACSYTPANAPAAITVGATGYYDGRASFSNYGTCVDIFAPGVSISSDTPEDDWAWNRKSGTSMACPHVAGAVALVLERAPAWTPRQVANVLLHAATQNAVSDSGHGSPNLLLYAGFTPADFCARRCRQSGYGCNDYRTGSGGRISCAQACMMRAGGSSFGQLWHLCSRGGSGRCYLTVNKRTYNLCGCSDGAVRGSRECQAGAMMSPWR